MKSYSIRGGIKFRLLSIFTLLLSALFALLNLIEFVKVGLLKQSAGYPFGTEGPTPYYYKSPELYSKVCLIYGLLFLIILVITFWSVFKRKKKVLFVVSITSVLLVLSMIVSGISEMD
jgi:hypothetical protein